jgi:hypothetical protein
MAFLMVIMHRACLSVICGRQGCGSLWLPSLLHAGETSNLSLRRFGSFLNYNRTRPYNPAYKYSSLSSRQTDPSNKWSHIRQFLVAIILTVPDCHIQIVPCVSLAADYDTRIARIPVEIVIDLMNDTCVRTIVSCLICIMRRFWDDFSILVQMVPKPKLFGFTSSIDSLYSGQSFAQKDRARSPSIQHGSVE